MMKKKIALFVAMSLLVMASVASAANKAETVTFTPVVGAYLFDGKQHLEANEVYGARVGYNFTDAFGIEALFDYSNNNQSTHPAIKPSISMYRYGGEVLYHFFPSTRFVPYVAAGFAGVNFDGNSDGSSNKGYKRTQGAFDYGIGAKLFMSENIALRGDVRQIIYKYDKTYSNYESTVGIYFAFGGAAPVVKPVEPAPAPEPVAAPVDSDGDGVPDTLDRCPGTPAGVAVDKDGCPLDTDKDGVADYLDKCPNTPAGVKVDMNGCEIVSVQKAAAAERFCSKPAVLAINFDSDKSDIKAKYYDELKTVGNFLTYFPNAKGEISGHTDSTASNAHNQKLSERRADSVEKFITKTFGVNPGRITVKGYGETKPIASNKTKAGRAKNRRIVANFTCD